MTLLVDDRVVGIDDRHRADVALGQDLGDLANGCTWADSHLRSSRPVLAGYQRASARGEQLDRLICVNGMAGKHEIRITVRAMEQ